MNKKDITNSLSHLQRLRLGGEPDSRWVAQTRSHLLESVREDAQASARPGFLARLRTLQTLFPTFHSAPAFQPMLASVMVVAVVIGASVSAVSAAMGSLPGDVLYPVKIASERMQVAAAQSEQTKAELGVAFLGRRVEEVQQIVDQGHADAPARVDAAVKKMKEDVGAMQDRLSSVQKNAPEAAVSVAKLIDVKSSEYNNALAATAAQLPPVEQHQMREARAMVNDLSVQAVIMLVQAHEDDASSISSEEVAQTVGNKINSISDAAARVVVQSTSTAQAAFGQDTAVQALTALGAAQSFLNDNQFTPALSKVIEGKELVSAAEKIVDATSGAAALTALSSSTSTTGAHLGGGTGSVGLEPLPSATDDPAPTSSPTSPPVTGVTTSTSPSSGG